MQAALSLGLDADPRGTRHHAAALQCPAMQAALIAVAVALAIGVALIFNRLVGLRNRARNAWSDIDVQLKRRHDLVANLVEVVEGYMAHERQTLEGVTRARTRAENARREGTPGRAAASENDLSGGLRTLFALAEGYPDLEASDRFGDLHRALVGLEDALQNARRYYNAVVRDLNTRIQSFPDLLLARLLGFTEWEFFQLDDRAEAAAPSVEIGGAS
jgi:LemA protein